MKTILVTGGAGFIGANFVAYWQTAYPADRVITLDKLTYAGSKANLADIPDPTRHRLIEGDIADMGLVHSILESNRIDGIFHFAAESHVDNSIADPGVFVQSNLVGTYTMLEAARRHWMNAPFDTKLEYADCRFHHVSTDEVYGSLGSSGFFTENTSYAPNSPYSATKAGSDFLARAYFHTYGLNVVTTNCSNNYGPRQHREKLIPTIIRSALQGLPIPIYGDGQNVRDWLYVDDHCRAIDRVFSVGRSGETYLIGARNEWPNLRIATTICERLDGLKPRPDGQSYTEQITFVKDRPGHDVRYAIDPEKIETELGWRPETDFADGLETTIRWYLNRGEF
ncbi:dTDP-glucose 4,6-dehydratase [bacterium]|nr:dTDP-glucose 4,6-dehydratase [bacterium]